MSIANVLLIAAGGAVGSVARALVARMIPASGLPWGTIVVNVIGSLLIGWWMARLAGSDSSGRSFSFLVVGVCGGFTTFSTFSWQTFALMQKGEWGLVVGNVLISVLACLGATWAGWKWAQ